VLHTFPVSLSKYLNLNPAIGHRLEYVAGHGVVAALIRFDAMAATQLVGCVHIKLFSY
jgi:hypothetical protein